MKIYKLEEDRKINNGQKKSLEKWDMGFRGS